MRLFSIASDTAFREYVATDFSDEHSERILEDWLERNPDSIVEDGAL